MVQNKKIKYVIVVIIIAMAFIAIGISNLLVQSMNKIYQPALSKLSEEMNPGKPAEGETDPGSYNYNVNIPHFEIKDTSQTTGDPEWLPLYGNFEIYCIQPGVGLRYGWEVEYEVALSLVGKTFSSAHGCATLPHEGDRTPVQFTPEGGGTLSPAIAYIISDEPVGVWTRNKQLGVWNLYYKYVTDPDTGETHRLDGGLIMSDPANSTTGCGPSTYDQEAEDYGDFDIKVRDKGMRPEDQTVYEEVYVDVDQTKDELTVGPFTIDYTTGVYGDIAFGGISDMKLKGYNKEENEVRDDIEVERFVFEDDLNEGKEPEYFEPDNMKVDETEQVYPEPGKKFWVVIKNPNAGLSEDDPDRIASVNLKIKFQRMQADGKYTRIKATRYTVIASPHVDTPHKDPIPGIVGWGQYGPIWGIIGYRDCHSCIKTGALSAEQMQWLMAADAKRTIFEEEIELDKVKVSITMDLGGHVWEDSKTGKESLADGVSNTSGTDENGNEFDRRLKNVKVTLYTEDGEIAQLLSDPNKGEIMSRVNPTYTNEDGEYFFKGIDPMKKYYVTFEYNGQIYLPTEYLVGGSGNVEASIGIYNTEIWEVNSKGTEKPEDRDAYDNKFAQIGSYPENYPSDNEIGGKNGYNATFTQKDLMGYTLSPQGDYVQTEQQLIDGFLYDNEGNQTSEYQDGVISTKIREYIEQNKKFPDEDELKGIYQQIAGGDEETLMKLQFIEDCKIESYTQAQGGDYDLYPVYDIFRINHDTANTEFETLKEAREGDYDLTVEVIEGTERKPIYPGQFYINQGLWRRQESDIYLRKDVYKATLKINGRTEVYDYDERDLLTQGERDTLDRLEIEYGKDSDQYLDYEQSLDLDQRFWEIRSRIANGMYDYYYGEGYTRPIYPSDYEYTGQNKLEAYVTYKITVRNQSQSILMQVDEIVDYFDSSYTFMPNLSWVMYRGDHENKEDIRVRDQEFYDIMTSGNKNVSGAGKFRDVNASATGNYSANTRFSLGSNYNSVYVNGLAGHKFITGENGYVYLTFKVNGEGNSLSIENSNTEAGKQNISEINGYTTYYADGTTLPNGITKGSGDYAGIIDRDSNPGNFTKEKLEDKAQGRYEHHFEDDTDRARGITVYVDDNLIRKVSGVVWEDKRTHQPDGTDALVGNGVRETGEVTVGDIKVELHEVVNGKTNEEIAKIWNGSSWVDAVATTGADGKYQFEGYAPGDYIVRFLYGGTHYNGQDFKSTSYQTNHTNNTKIDQNGQTDVSGPGYLHYYGYTDPNDSKQNETAGIGYNIYKSDLYEQNLSDAKDIWSKREAVNKYSSNNYGGVTNNLAQELDNHTSGSKLDMTAETGVIRMEIEYNRETSQGNNTYDNNGYRGDSQNHPMDYENGNNVNNQYHLQDVDFGLEERPKAQLELNKQVSNVKITLANQTILFDTTQKVEDLIWQSKTPYNINEEKETTTYDTVGPNVKTNSAKNAYSDYTRYDDFRNAINERIESIVTKQKGLIQATMDEELMHGSTIQITYDFKVTNVGEVDYKETTFYYTGKVQNKGTIVKTSSDVVVDYVANNLQYREDSNDEKWGWKTVRLEELTRNGYINDEVKAELEGTPDPATKKNTILQTESLKKGLIPLTKGTKDSKETYVETQLILTQLITSQNKEDDLSYGNIAEIVKISNDVGRRMAYSVQGNQKPSELPTEADASRAEQVIILPPFGEQYLYLGLGILVVLLLGVSIVVIKKTVLNKNKF
ncbi:MAG: hypothetical protein HFJ28_04545 [Clostridia bacterium]|nr:hypothetical protein [Clostridia bacterium]